jgi:hypothetical protein
VLISFLQYIDLGQPNAAMDKLNGNFRRDDNTSIPDSKDSRDQKTIENSPKSNIFLRDINWIPHPLDLTSLSYVDLCLNGGPGGLICCESCTSNYSKFLSKCYTNLEEQKIAKLGVEITELLQFIEDAKPTLAETISFTRKIPVHHREFHEDDTEDESIRNDMVEEIAMI